MIRADGLSPFGMVWRAMSACAIVGIYKIECGAATPAEERRKIKG